MCEAIDSYFHFNKVVFSQFILSEIKCAYFYHKLWYVVKTHFITVSLKTTIITQIKTNLSDVKENIYGSL